MPENQLKPKVLVVDDERVIADTLAMILNQSGFEARPFIPAKRRVELASTFAPDMLITDVIMADLNGIDAAIQDSRAAAADQDPAFLRPGRDGRPA